MKIPSPEELRGEQAATNGPIVDAHVAQIVAGMKRATSGRIIIDISVPSDLRPLVAQRFAERGWSLKWWDDQRDGSSVEVTASSWRGVAGM